ncbi:MAG: DUF1579 domain-containing protein [Isosphaeraceae bacterium]
MFRPIFALTISCLLAHAATAQEPQQALPEHKLLAAEEGTWDAAIKTFEAGPDAAPSVSKGTEVNELLPGGLWIISKFEGDFGGMKFHGRGQYGYDPVKKKYVGTWLDSMSTILSVLEGDYDAKAKTLTFTGDGYDPVQKAKFSQRMVTAMKDDGSRVFTLYMKYEGQPAEAKFMEITYTKRK